MTRSDTRFLFFMKGSVTKRAKAAPSLVFTVTEVTAVGYNGLRVYGRTKETGESVCAKTTHFRPYFYVSGHDTDIDKVRETLRVTFDKGPSDERFIESVECVERISIMGYQPNGAMLMQRLTLTSPRYVSLCRDILENEGRATYEGNVNFVMRYMVDREFGGNDWVSIESFHPVYERETRCAIEVEFDGYLERLPEESEVGVHQKWLAFDIEACKGGTGRGFVNPKDDMVSQIGNTLFNSKYETLDRRVFSMGGSVAKLPHDIHVQVYTDEREMLLGWRDYIRERDPDVFTGYNIDGFDWWYLFERAKTLGIYDEFRDFSRDLERKATIKKSTFQSAAKGMRVDYAVNVEGRFNFDMYKFIKDTKKLRSYKLGSVSQELLGDSKVEMPYENIPIYQAGTDEQRAHLCYYCWYDADLCMRLMKKRMAIVNYVESARVCGVPMKFLITRGQQVLTQSLLLRFGRLRHIVLPSSTESQNDEDTQGATVLDPDTGMYEDPIAVLDFASLYPSIIRDKNICYSTKTPLKWAREHLRECDYFVPPMKNCHYCFVKEHVWRGLLAEIEETLFNKRLQAKADLKRETDNDKKDVLDGRQLAIKVRMNSIYGFLKANMICDKDLMETVTGVGRSMIDDTKAIVEANFAGSRVIYGDSVTGDTPCLVKHIATGRISFQRICDIGQSRAWEERKGDAKEYIDDDIEYMAWTEQGWSNIKRIIRHKTNKPLYRVQTHSGVVDCTEDHGLVTKAGKKRVSVKELSLGSELLHSLPLKEMQTIPLDVYADMYLNVVITDKLRAANVYAVFKLLGYAVHIDLNSRGDVIIRDGHDGSCAIRSMTRLAETCDYVYDLETENHHFHAGVGEMIVHNTDSVFVMFGQGLDVKQAFEMGARASTMCTAFFNEERAKQGQKWIHNLEMEKVFKPHLQIGKKKYAGYKYMGPDVTPFVDSSGLENVRRDNALITSETLELCLTNFLKNGDTKGTQSIAYIHDLLHKLLTGRIEISKLIISKNLSKSFKHYDESGSMLPHVELAKKMKARGDEEYHTGDRVKFVVICGTKGAKSSECAEDPAYVLRNRVQIDYNYYVYNQLMKPLLRIFTPILAPREKLTKENKDGKTVYINDEEIKRLTAYKALFTGNHMMHKVQRVKEGTGTGMMRFAKKLPTCVGCGCSSKDSLCPSCEPRRTSIYLQLNGRNRELEQQAWQAWTRCQRCVGDKHVHKIHCSNKDCDNFYQREKVIYDIEDLAEKFNKLQ